MINILSSQTEERNNKPAWNRFGLDRLPRYKYHPKDSSLLQKPFVRNSNKSGVSIIKLFLRVICNEAK
jgi:hypothetical protein